MGVMTAMTATVAVAGCLALSSCFIVKVPLSVTGAVLEGTAKVGSKTASAAKDAFTKSEEEKEADEKKKELKDAEKKKQEQLKQAQDKAVKEAQEGLIPSSGNGGQDPSWKQVTPGGNPGDPPPYKPSITPDMIKKGQTEQPVTPTPVQGGY